MSLASHLAGSTEGAVHRVFVGESEFAAPAAFVVPFPTVVGEMELVAFGGETRIVTLVRQTIREALPAIREAIERYGAARVGVILGTCTGGLDATERAYADLRGGASTRFDFDLDHVLQNACTELLKATGATGPSLTISTACSSSAKAVPAAQRWIHFGIADAVVLVGVDTLCLTTLHGFASLAALSRAACRPFDVARDGITLAEGGACIVVDGDASRPAPIAISGTGEGSDAHHQTAPDPGGGGAYAAMRKALDAAGLAPGDVAAVNAHGTATPQNDSAEGIAIHALFGPVATTSTKGATGHLLGGAGLTEVVLAAETLLRGAIPPTVGTTHPMDSLDIVLESRALPAPTDGTIAVISNSFGFGGSNVSVLLQRSSGQRPAAARPALFPSVRVAAVSFFSPVFENAEAFLRGDHRPAQAPRFALIPGRLRRFTSLVSQMHLEVIGEALDAAGLNPAEVLSVFGSVYGELGTTVEILEAIHFKRPVSPARFAQSVHNTPSGLFSVATKNTLASMTIAGGSPLFAQALLEGAILVGENNAPVVVSLADEAPQAIFRAAALDSGPLPDHAIAVVLVPALDGGKFRRVSSTATLPEPTSAISAIRTFLQARRSRTATTLPLGGAWSLEVRSP